MFIPTEKSVRSKLFPEQVTQCLVDMGLVNALNSGCVRISLIRWRMTDVNFIISPCDLLLLLAPLYMIMSYLQAVPLTKDSQPSDPGMVLRLS